jgi:hypothetical protein
MTAGVMSVMRVRVRARVTLLLSFAFAMRATTPARTLAAGPTASAESDRRSLGLRRNAFLFSLE